MNDEQLHSLSLKAYTGELAMDTHRGVKEKQTKKSKESEGIFTGIKTHDKVKKEAKLDKRGVNISGKSE